jgi:hypothetical protein
MSSLRQAAASHSAAAAAAATLSLACAPPPRRLRGAAPRLASRRAFRCRQGGKGRQVQSGLTEPTTTNNECKQTTTRDTERQHNEQNAKRLKQTSTDATDITTANDNNTYT